MRERGRAPRHTSSGESTSGPLAESLRSGSLLLRIPEAPCDIRLTRGTACRSLPSLPQPFLFTVGRARGSVLNTVASSMDEDLDLSQDGFESDHVSDAGEGSESEARLSDDGRPGVAGTSEG
eukprot:13562858-Alexandrium_andersonii.AAC.1